ncbi:GFA family protein [Pseudooceanicola nanhaiensis]|uniref:GFA family protein n=1 Tax=Pseudooceanicola nanhaiensis TaxID=375761 RepID=UPI004059574D
MICNCSRCRRLGAVLAFTPLEGGFRLERGAEAVSEYRFNTGTIQHLFCATCGIRSHSVGQMPDGTRMAGVNVNCLEGVDARALSPKLHDGASFQARSSGAFGTRPHQPPSWPSPDPGEGSLWPSDPDRGTGRPVAVVGP